jgi:hypothetical protein
MIIHKMPAKGTRYCTLDDVRMAGYEVGRKGEPKINPYLHGSSANSWRAGWNKGRKEFLQQTLGATGTLASLEKLAKHIELGQEIQRGIIDSEDRIFLDQHYRQIATKLKVKGLRRNSWTIEIDGVVFKFNVTTFAKLGSGW